MSFVIISLKSCVSQPQNCIPCFSDCSWIRISLAGKFKELIWNTAVLKCPGREENPSCLFKFCTEDYIYSFIWSNLFKQFKTWGIGWGRERANTFKSLVVIHSRYSSLITLGLWSYLDLHYCRPSILNSMCASLVWELSFLRNWNQC